METALSVCLGLGLAAACGFRIFVPLLIINLAHQAEWLSLTPSFEWLGSTPALIAFGAATALEIGAYYVPWLDNLLDTVASPAAVVAGVIVTASVVTGMDPMLKWTLAVIAGGGVAGSIQALTSGTRHASAFTTAGLANPVVSTIEVASSFALSVLSILVPLLAFTAVVVFLYVVGRRLFRRRAAAV